ncbi:MAG: YkoF family thiamine/hydroxymethylpyrimidine-binding protein [Halieaceae bacterium]|jgi:uncharacterized protein YqgV (UPF0045/DUF77 family)|nr:YkoF family thiamine/hydroxymethylpyrimidine-binding protein [Halieaceae bacterium]
MKLTAELSLYPLQDDYLPAIDAIIADLNTRPDLKVQTNAMSTQISGDYSTVFDAIQTALAQSVEAFGRQVLVCKFIASELL